METQLKAQNAHERREQFLDFTNRANAFTVQLAHEMWKNKDYTSLGFESFEDYCNAPVESGGLGRSRTSLVKDALAYEKFNVELGVPVEKILEIGAKKLYSFKDCVDEDNIDDFLHKAKTMSANDLRRDMKGIDQDTCSHEVVQTIRRCRDCNKLL